MNKCRVIEGVRPLMSNGEFLPEADGKQFFCLQPPELGDREFDMIIIPIEVGETLDMTKGAHVVNSLDFQGDIL